jgi:hypothetical protein
MSAYDDLIAEIDAINRETDRLNRRAYWLALAAVCILLITAAIALSGCGDTINPVRYQTVPVLVTQPCFKGRTPPAEAVVLTDPICGPGDARCVIQAAADINELKREAREFRKLFKECSK